MGKGFVSAKAINDYTWKSFQYLEEKVTMFMRAGQGIKGVTLGFCWYWSFFNSGVPYLVVIQK